jgi:hypothetical protein
MTPLRLGLFFFFLASIKFLSLFGMYRKVAPGSVRPLGRGPSLPPRLIGSEACDHRLIWTPIHSLLPLEGGPFVLNRRALLSLLPPGRFLPARIPFPFSGSIWGALPTYLKVGPL